MLITTEQLSKFSGVYPDDSDLQTIYIGSATEIINGYLKFDCEAEDASNKFASYDETTEAWTITLPSLVKLVALEIATLIQLEESQNIGVNNKSFSESGSRTFLNVTKYDPYLNRLSQYRAV